MLRPDTEQRKHLERKKKVFMLLVERMHKNICIGNIFSSIYFLNSKHTLLLKQVNYRERNIL